ncbi:MAG: Wzz/FepE/Etk N-terminal domain-containing protein [Candidatus Riflemargulisbacteria bacterium]
MIQQKTIIEPSYIDDEIDVVELLKVLFKYWMLIVSITITATVIGIIFATIAIPTYKAEAKFFIPQQDKSALSGYMSAISSLGLGGLGGGNSSSEVVLNLINSKRMAKDIVVKFDLVKVYQERNSKKKIEADTNDQENMLYSAIIQLKGSLSVNSDKSGLITLGIEDQNPQLAADIANYMVVNLDVMNEELKLSSQKPMVTVLDPAEKPLVKAKPNKKMFVIVGFITGGVLSVFLAFVLEYLKKAFNK